MFFTYDSPFDNNLNLIYIVDSIIWVPGNSFKFKVYILNNLGNGDYSDEITILNCGSHGTPVITVNSRTLDFITFSFSSYSNDIIDTSFPIKI